MKYTLEQFTDSIKALPIKKKYTKEELLTPDFLIEQEGSIEIYYAPHNEYLNAKAKIFIVGITPGFEQMSTAISEARTCIEENLSLKEIQYRCKKAGRFSGSLRQNLIHFLNDLNLNEKLGIESASELFEEHDQLLHTISLVPYSVFVKGKNYTGHTPQLLKSSLLMSYVKKIFIGELDQLDSVLIIPLGKSVEEVLLHLAEESLINESQILKGFPHPSGANGHRFKQFDANKESMMLQIDEWFTK